MKKLNTKGFGAAEALLIVVIVGIIGGAGYMVYNSQKKTNQSLDNASSSLNNASQSNKTVDSSEKLVKSDYSAWTKSTDRQLNENEIAHYTLRDGTATLTVFKTRPIIYYSSNAPVYCAHEGGAWIHYSAIGTNPPVYSKDENSDACKSVEQTQLAGMTASTRYGGAMGQTTLSAVIENNSEWFVFEDYKNQDNVNLSDSEVRSIEDNLKASLEQTITKTFTE